MSSLIKIEHTHYHSTLSDFINAIKDAQLKHYASDLLPELELNDEESFNHSLARAQQVCTTLNLPINEHFKRVYRTFEGRVYCDYKLSHTAYILVSINGDVNSKKVAKIQMELVSTLMKKQI